VSTLGLIGLFAVYAVVGVAALWLLGLTFRRRPSWPDLPLAVVAGWAVVGVVTSFVLVAGGGVVAGVVCTLVLAGVAAVAAARRDELMTWQAARVERLGLLGWGAATLLSLMCALFVAKGVWWTGNFHIDVWSFWIPKAKTIYFFGGLDTGTGGFTQQTSADYPPMKPAIDALVFTSAGKADPLLLPIHNALLDVAFLGALLSLLQRRIGTRLALISAAAIAALPGFVPLVGSSLGDESLAIAISIAVVSLCVTPPPRTQVVVLAGLFLTAATLLKNEGAMLSLAVLLAAGLSRLVRCPRQLGLLAVGPLLAAMSWKIWLSSNHVPPNSAYHLNWFFHPLRLIHHTHHLQRGVVGLTRQTVSLHWALALLICFLLAVTHLRDTSSVGRFVSLLLPLWLLGYLAIYWVSIDATWNRVEENVGRIYAPLTISAIALIPLLAVPATQGEPQTDESHHTFADSATATV
jgi:hypothetical protein